MSNQVKAKKPWNAWTTKEKDLFEQLYKQYQKDFGRYVKHFEGRTEIQLRSFYYYNRQEAKKRDDRLTETTTATKKNSVEFQ